PPVLLPTYKPSIHTGRRRRRRRRRRVDGMLLLLLLCCLIARSLARSQANKQTNKQTNKHILYVHLTPVCRRIDGGSEGEITDR
ncbi:hypothetical protein IWX91DRAFT_347013, partial [Phyllosticta citricarpa]